MGQLINRGALASDKVLTDTFHKYFFNKAKDEIPNDSGMPLEKYNKKLNKEIINPAVTKIKELIEGAKSEIVSPSELLKGLIKFTESEEEIQKDLKSFRESNIWKEELNKYNKKQNEVQENNSKVILKSQAKTKIGALALNQMDSKGIFFYEPMDRISDPKYDLAYIIQLQDLITLKITKKVQENGDLFNLLIQKRVAMLTSNFSDRLLNIMGNSFSKIGTPDIMSDDILVLYKNVYPGDFYTSINEYKKHNST